jgi:RecB family exonuclease
MDSGMTNPIQRLAAQQMRITPPKLRDQPRERAVTDLLQFRLCPHNARFFSEGRYPSHTPSSVMGQILHRTIKHLHGRYREAQHRGDTSWIPDEQTALEECRIVEEAIRLQGLPQLFSEKQAQLRQMLSAFHTLEAHWFYPLIRHAEVHLSWIWEDAPGGPILLKGTVDVVLLQQGNDQTGIALWDYKTGKCPPKGSPELRNYEQQMKLYGFLYRQCFNEAPQETALYFMRELERKTPLTERPQKALHRVPVTEDDDEVVREWLGDTLTKELACEEQNRWDPPPPGAVPQQTCRNCGVRWSCSSFRQPFPWESGGDQEDEPDPPEWWLLSAEVHLLGKPLPSLQGLTIHQANGRYHLVEICQQT